MQKLCTIFLTILCLTSVSGQSLKKVSGYLSMQYNHTLYDRTLPNNPWSIGLGLQTYFNNRSKLKLTVDLTADAYLEDDKVFRLDSDSSAIPVVRGMVNVFPGASYYPSQRFFLSLVAGPGFVSGRMLFGFKTSLGFYFSSKQKWTGKFYYINLFNRDEKTKRDFGSAGVALAVRLF